MKIYLTIILLVFSLIASTQSKIIDSLKTELQKNNHDTIRAEILGDLAYYYFFEDIDSSLSYSSNLTRFSKKIKSNKFVVLANNYKGSAYMLASNYDSSRYYFELALKQSDSFNLSKSGIYNNMGVLYKRQGNYDKALKVYLSGYKYDKKNRNEYGEYLKLTNIANLYNHIGEADNFLKYSEKALELSKNSNNNNILFSAGTHLNNIGIHYVKKGKDEIALSYFKKSLEQNLKYDNKKELSRNYHNIGSTLDRLAKPNEAIINLEKALKLRTELDDKHELTETNMVLGTVYGKRENKNRAQNYFKKALDLSYEENDLALISEVYKAISDNYLVWNQSNNAFENYKQHIKFRDSIFNIENKTKRTEIETKYETEKKDKDLLEQQLAIEQKELELQKKQSQYKLMTGLAIFLLISSLLTWFLYQQRQKRKNQEILTLKREQQVKTLELLMEGEEKERFRIAKELHDGVNVDLSAIKYKLTSLLEKNNEVINEAVSMIDKSCEQVRAISHNLVPPALKDFRLIEALEDYCTTTNSIHDTKVSFQTIGNAIDMSKKAEPNVFRIVQELVNNSIKHAEASEIDVQISYQNDTIQLTVEDNGKGFDINAEKSNGIGLQNINSRVAYLNGKLDIASDNKGSSFVIDININELS